MKTLKRTLCLVLVLVMVAGLLSVCANAAFTDDGKITYKEAVGVMSGMGIIKGRDNGAFDPNGNVSRAEIATMIYKAVTGDSEGKMVGAYTSNKFKDVPANEWCAGYVSFAANKGIVVGDGDGNFRPYGQVTGYEALVMVIRALGYDAENAGKEITNAPDWKVAAIDRARALGIIGNILDVNYDKPITREVAAEIIYRAFMNDVVSYSKLLETYTDVDVAYLLDNYNYDGDVLKAQQVTDVKYSDVTKKVMATAGSKTFAADYDAIGHVYNLYVKNDGTVIYAEKISDVAVVTKADVENKAYAVDSGAKVIQNYKIISGTATANEKDAVIYVPAAKAGEAAVVYATLKADTKTIEKVTVSISESKNTKGDITVKLGETVLYTKDVSESKVVNKTNIDFSMFAKGDYYFIVTKNNAETDAYSLTATTTVDGKVSTFSVGTQYVVDGTAYKVSAIADNSGISDVTIANNTTTYRFYLANGEIFAIGNADGTVTTSTEYAYIYATYSMKSSDEVKNELGQVVTPAKYAYYYAAFNANGEKVTYMYAKDQSAPLTVNATNNGAFAITVNASTGLATKGDALPTATTQAKGVSAAINGINVYYNTAKALYVKVDEEDLSKSTATVIAVQDATASVGFKAPQTGTNATATVLFYTTLVDAPVVEKDLIFAPAGTAVASNSVWDAAQNKFVTVYTADVYVNGEKKTVTVSESNAFGALTENKTTEAKFYQYSVKDGIYSITGVDSSKGAYIEDVTNFYNNYVTTASITNANTAGVDIIDLSTEGVGIVAGETAIAAVYDTTNGFAIIYVLDALAD